VFAAHTQAPAPAHTLKRLRVLLAATITDYGWSFLSSNSTLSVGCANERNASGRIDVGRLQAERHAFVFKPRAKAVEIASHPHAEMVDSPLQAGLSRRELCGALAAHDNHRATERYVDLRRSVHLDAFDDCTSKIVDIPLGSGVGIFADKVDMIEGEA